MQSNNAPGGRGFYIGLAIGQFWLTLIGTACVAVIWILGQNPAQTILLLAGAAVIGLLLIGLALRLLFRARRLPVESGPEKRARARSTGKRMGLLFGLVVPIEAIVIGVLDFALGQSQHSEWILPVTYFVVGLHFIPLAFVFKVRSYAILGLSWMVILLTTILFTSANLNIGQGVSAWIFFPLLGCGLATWCTVAFILWENLKNVSQVVYPSVS